jgi:hypothetical protein
MYNFLEILKINSFVQYWRIANLGDELSTEVLGDEFICTLEKVTLKLLTWRWIEHWSLNLKDEILCLTLEMSLVITCTGEKILCCHGDDIYVLILLGCWVEYKWLTFQVTPHTIWWDQCLAVIYYKHMHHWENMKYIYWLSVMKYLCL